MARVLNKTINIIFIFVLIVLGGYFLLRLTGFVNLYRVESGSMEDDIHIYDYILSIKQNSYSVGDAITYNYNGIYVTHRITKINGDLLITKGDANNLEDEEININQVTGKVLLSGGLLNYVIDYKFVIVAFMLGLYLFSWYLDTIEKKEQ